MKPSLIDEINGHVPVIEGLDSGDIVQKRTVCNIIICKTFSKCIREIQKEGIYGCLNSRDHGCRPRCN